MGCKKSSHYGAIFIFWYARVIGFNLSYFENTVKLVLRGVASVAYFTIDHKKDSIRPCLLFSF